MINSKQLTLSEVTSKQILRKFGVTFAQESEVLSAKEAADVASKIGFPVAIKVCANAISHKTERGLVRLNIRDSQEAITASNELLNMTTKADGDVSLLVAKMESGRRELIVGLVRDDQFGALVMCGLGGVFAEVFSDIVFAPAPLSKQGALKMLARLKNQKALREFRGESAVDTGQLGDILVAVSNAGVDDPSIISIDINPVIVRPDGSLVAVDALVVKQESKPLDKPDGLSNRKHLSDDHFAALFEPRGVVVVGASTHPGKFGFVSLHNILASGYAGKIFATNLEQAKVLGIDCLASVDDLPENEVDLAFICTPASTNLEILRACSRKSIRAVYVTSAGYGEAGDAGRKAQNDLQALANELGILLLGPNGQGIVSTPKQLCAQIVGPYPPSGAISLISQSGNFVSSFMNYARQTKVGIARAVSAGNAAQVGIPEFFDFYANDLATKVVLAYIEGISDGYELARSMKKLSDKKPLVVVKGGSTDGGARAAASHTGALASDDRIFDGICASNNVIRVADAEDAFDIAATFATQPLPKGPNTIVLTTVGGWGVVTSDVIAVDGVLNLMQLPQDLSKDISALLPDRWSKNNPVDCAGGETRDTIADVMRLIAMHPQVDSIIFLGLGIQSNQARLMREGSFYDKFELARIVNYHEGQDEKYAQVAAELSIETGKPILVATELGVADPNNPGVLAVQKSGRLCYANGQRAARALSSVYRYANAKGHAN